MMKYKKLLLLALLSSILLPFTFSSADTHDENLYTGNSAFYLCALDEGETLTLNLTRLGTQGNFSMYLLNARPLSETTDMTAKVGTYYNNGMDIYYNATKSAIYYVQIILTDNGPAVFQIVSNMTLIRYYIPQIPGFPLEIVAISIAVGFGMIYVVRKRKTNQS